ncbi:MAG: ketoacyl-ACP synthase III [Gammaproteobacteria bacterium]|nr:ketoacyl-ACP synthase III [Gammaproteobacteria bacterium]
MLFTGHSQISGVGSYFPEQIVTSQELLEELKTETRFGIGHDWIDRKVGINERRYAPDHAKPSELAIIVAHQAIEDAGISPKDISAVIYCGIVGDQIEPSTAHNIQARIGAHNAMCRDVQNACHGFCDGMQDADMMIGSGAEHVLVVSTELTRVSRLAFPRLQRIKKKDNFMSMIGGLTVGDGAGAMILSRKETTEKGIQKINFHSEGKYADLCKYGYDIVNGKYEGCMSMAKISGVMIRLNGRLLKRTLTALNWTKGSIDHLIMHQVGQRTFDGMLKLTGVFILIGPVFEIQ